LWDKTEIGRRISATAQQPHQPTTQSPEYIWYIHSFPTLAWCSATTRWRYLDDHHFAIVMMKEKVLIVDMYGMAIGNGQPT
jgi:hypothetical protein